MPTPSVHPEASARSRRTPALLAATALAVLTLVVGAVGATAVQAAPPTTDPTTAADYGARWMASQFGPEGYVVGPGNAPDVTATVEGTLALATAGVEAETFDRAMTWLQANAATVIGGGADGNNPGRIGYLLLLAEAADIDPSTFGGLDLPDLLLATQGAEEPGLFGGADPTFDGVLRQSLAILGLVASGTAVPGTATTWLADQQCGPATPAAAGGWEDYRADLSIACSPPDPNNFLDPGPETNATAFAVQALVAAGSTAGVADALDFLQASQGADGGFPFIPGGEVDPNSTALVIQAIVAGGEDPSAAPWSDGTADPVTSLLSWQVGCDAPAADQGAFASPYSDGFPDAFATRQAIWGASGLAFPLAEVAFTTGAEPCLPPTTTTTSTTAPTSSSTSTTAPTTSTTRVPSGAARPVVADPRFAG